MNRRKRFPGLEFNTLIAYLIHHPSHSNRERFHQGIRFSGINYQRAALKLQQILHLKTLSASLYYLRYMVVVDSEVPNHHGQPTYPVFVPSGKPVWKIFRGECFPTYAGFGFGFFLPLSLPLLAPSHNRSSRRISAIRIW